MVGSDAWLKKYRVKRHRTLLRGQIRVKSAQAWMLESRAERSALGAASDIAAVDVGLNFYVQKLN